MTLIVRPGDDRYEALTVGYNRRFTASPTAVHLVRTAGEAADAVAGAVRTGSRLSVRGGGHCFADFVYHRQARLIVDLSLMDRVGYDEERRAFVVEAGARLSEVYATLYRGWGVTLPGGFCPHVGIAGHTTGGGLGILSRLHGVVADHVEAVEAVVADGEGDRAVRTVIASRESSGDLNDLWWAACGGGGGTFGLITRFWFRTPGASGDSPGSLLPRPPKDVLLAELAVPWDRVDEAAFTALLTNYTRWYAEHRTPAPPTGALSSLLMAAPRAGGPIRVVALIDAALPDAGPALDAFLADVTAGTGLPVPPALRAPWPPVERRMGITTPETTLDMTRRIAVKSAWHRSELTERQCAAIYRNLTRDDYANAFASVLLLAAGGRLTTVPDDAIAFPHRDVAYVALFESFWTDPREDAEHLRWQRRLYGEVYEDTGGYPVPGDRTDGCYVNSPDLDIADPARNASGVPWHELYWKGNYPRLQRAKRRWDPADVFRHSQSVRLD